MPQTVPCETQLPRSTLLGRVDLGVPFNSGLDMLEANLAITRTRIRVVTNFHIDSNKSSHGHYKLTTLV